MCQEIEGSIGELPDYLQDKKLLEISSYSRQELRVKGDDVIRSDEKRLNARLRASECQGRFFFFFWGVFFFLYSRQELRVKGDDVIRSDEKRLNARLRASECRERFSLFLIF